MISSVTLNRGSESAQEAEHALEALRGLLRRKRKFIRMHSQDSEKDISLPREAVELLIEMLDALVSGQTVAVVAMQRMLTTQEAADILQVSRPHLVALLESNQIPYRKIGKHRRVALHDLLQYMGSTTYAQKTSLDELASLAQQHTIGY